MDSLLMKANRSENNIDNKTEQHTDCGRQQEGEGSPLEAVCFFFYGKTCGAAGKMEKAHRHHAKGSLPGPAVAGKDLVQFTETAVVSERTGGHIAHEHYGYDDLICRKAEDECHQDDTVKTKKLAQWIKKIRAVFQYGRSADICICQQPYYNTCGGGNDHSSAKNKNCTV